MNTHSFIPHRLFVAALSGGHKPPTPAAGQPLQVTVETDIASATASMEEKRRRETASTLTMRRMLSLGTGAGI